MSRALALVCIPALLLGAPGPAAADVIHVDQAAICGLGDGSVATPYCTIQQGIDAAVAGDQVLVAPGTYVETLDYLGKAITVASTAGYAQTTIDGNGGGPVVLFGSFEGQDSVLDGFTVTNGFTGISCSGTEPTIRNCAIVRNFSQFVAASAIACNGFGPHSSFPELHPVIENCLIARNLAVGQFGGPALRIGNLSSPIITNTTITENISNLPSDPVFPNAGGIQNQGSFPVITNCILWNNQPQDLVNDPSALPIGLPDVSFSDVGGGWIGPGNLDTDPLFVDPDADDFHLSQFSPCVDTGTNTPAGGLLTTDLEGDDRVVDGDGDSLPVVDMGADEVATAECFLVIGPAPGIAPFLPGLHLFAAQLAPVTASWAVTLTEIPEIPLAPAGLLPTGIAFQGPGGGGVAEATVLCAQVLMWNPAAFPANPAQWSNGVALTYEGANTWTASNYGLANGMQLSVDVVATRKGPVARFSFRIAGL